MANTPHLNKVSLTTAQFGKCFRKISWAIIPLLVITIFQINNHLYYDLGQGYDADQHFVNSLVLLDTGQMPPAPLTGTTYEAFQAPLFYILSAATIRFAQSLNINDLYVIAANALFVLSLAWLLLLIVLVQVAMRRVPGWIKALTVCVIMMLPVNIEASVMYSNDLPLIALGTLTAFTMWFMLRSGRYLRFKYWLRCALLVGITIMFKLNGIVLLATYLGLALYLMIDTMRHCKPRLSLRLLWMSAFGLPFMLIPFWLNTYHTMRYVNDPAGAVIPRTDPTVINTPFYVSFDTTIFQMPFAFEAGSGSYWSLQYVTLHGDYYNHWMLPRLTERIRRQDPSVLIKAPHRWDFPYWHLNEAILLQYLGIPVTLLMALPLLVGLWQVFGDWIHRFRPRLKAVRSGAILVILLIAAAQAAQFIRFVNYQDIRAVIIHSRFQAYCYGFLLVVGLNWYWRTIGRRRGFLRDLLTAGIGAVLIAYTAVSFIFMWQVA